MKIHSRISVDLRLRGQVLLAAVALLAMSIPSIAEDEVELINYEPVRQVSGTLRSWGDPHMSSMLKRWQAGFQKFHPDIRFVDTLNGTASAQWGLQAWVADIALMSREIHPYEYYGTYRRSYNFPVAIEVATGSADVPGKAEAVAIFVHKDNPLARLTIEQLDGIFSAQRTGGWQGLNWVTDGVARGSEGNIRRWSDVGLAGDWADAHIIPYGAPSVGTGAVSYFQSRVSGGAGARNEKLREYADPKKLMEALGNDRRGIGYAGLSYKTKDVKVVALAHDKQGPYVEPSGETVASRTYPLTGAAYIYFTVDTKSGDLADPLVDPKVHEFLRYILSRQGQQDVAEEGDYLPLSLSIISEQLAKLENPPTTRIYRKDRR